MLCLLRQNILPSLHRHYLIFLPHLYCLHLDEVLAIHSKPQPNSVKRSLHHRQLLRHLSNQTSLRLKRYEPAGYGSRATRIPRSARSHDKRWERTKEFPPLPSKAAPKVFSSRSSDSRRTGAMPVRLSHILPLTEKQGQNTCCFYLQGL